MNILKKTSLAISIALLSACGGGGGGSSASSGNVLVATVATGAPVIDAKVTVIDALGNSEDCASTTNDEGKLSCPLKTATTAPYFIRAQQKSMDLYAVLPDTSSTVNVTPLSDVMARKFASDNNLQPASIMGNPENMKSTSKASAQSAVDLVNAIVKVIALQTAGITIENALTQAYTPSNKNDAFDKFVHNIHISSDADGINISIPTSSGTVSINVAYNTSSATAASDVTTSTQGITANLSDADAIEALLNGFMTKLPTCATSSSERQNMASKISGTYMDGHTVAGWVSKICDAKLPFKSTAYSRSLARFGNKSINSVGIKTDSGDSVEMTFSFIKVAGTWKIMADNMPVNMSLKTRHALTYKADDSLSGSLQTQVSFERYVDTWINEDTDQQIANALPETIELYALEMKDAANDWTSANFPASPAITVYRNNSCNNPYTAYPASANRCDSFAREADYRTLFNKLEKADFTLIVMKLKDGSGNCMNCDPNDGLPTSGSVIGRALSVSKLFGPNITAAQLSQGVTFDSLPSDFEKNARVFYAMPSNAQLAALTSSLMSTNLNSKITVPWQRATGKNQQINGVWGNMGVCASNIPWIGLDEPDNSFNLTSNQWEFTAKPDGNTFNNASDISLTIANRVNESEFAFYIDARRNRNCTP